MDIIIDKDLRFIFSALPSFGTRYSHLVMGYAQLFGVTPMHLKAKKFRIIIEEIKKLFDAQSFAWEKKTYTISHAGIGEALDIMIKRDFSKHLTNHNYLKSVMITISEREGKNQSRQAEKNLRKKEDGLMSGRRAGSPNTPQLPDPDGEKEDAVEEVIVRITPEEAQKNIERVRSIIKGMDA